MTNRNIIIALIHIFAFPVVLIPCWILWPDAPLAVTVAIVFGLLLSLIRGVWIIMRDVIL